MNENGFQRWAVIRRMATWGLALLIAAIWDGLTGHGASIEFLFLTALTTAWIVDALYSKER